MIRLFAILCTLAVLGLPAAGTATERRSGSGAPNEVVVTLGSPPLAGRTGLSRRHAAAAVGREQARFVAALRKAVPAVAVRWRYRLVLNGIAVVVPGDKIPLLRTLPGVASVDVGAAYPLAAATTTGTTAGRAWTAGLPNQGAGMKIGIIDDGIDRTHPYFAPAGYAMPSGFPKGQTAYTSAKVIVARAFAPPGATWKHAAKPFDPVESGHATHVAGIAAGNAGTRASDGTILSGIAPRAYLGNYKALTVPTDAGVGLDGNAAELVAAIEAAVADGMDVINLSIGEPEVEPSRDLVALALDAAAEAGVIPVVAAGNDFSDFGRGSLSSPGTSSGAITVAAVTTPGTAGGGTLADFSAAGPTPLSLRLKPDISAPGVSILSSVPGGRWEALSGTSMASPQVAGAAALLRERHPEWSVAQLKAALIGSASSAIVDGQVAAPTRGGGGLAEPARADVPLVLAAPAAVSFGLVQPGLATSTQVELSDAGGGQGAWDVAVETVTAAVGSALDVPPSVAVPGTLALSPVVTPDATDGDTTGFVRLTRGADTRRIPFWFRVVRPALGSQVVTNLTAPGVRIGNTTGRPALVSRYRYPDVPTGGVVSAVLLGPEQVFRVTLTRPVANFGVVITGRGKGVLVEPRVVAAADENRLTGYAALPVNLNPYLAQFGESVLAAGSIRPRAGVYSVVFDSRTIDGAGSYSFRYWLDDTRPPAAKLVQARVRRGSPLQVAVSDNGSGVDPTTVKASIDGRTRSAQLRAGRIRVATEGLRPGRHRLRLQVSDYQESRNMENVPPILPNTRVLTTTVVIR